MNKIVLSIKTAFDIFISKIRIPFERPISQRELTLMQFCYYEGFVEAWTIMSSKEYQEFDEEHKTVFISSIDDEIIKHMENHNFPKMYQLQKLNILDMMFDFIDKNEFNHLWCENAKTGTCNCSVAINCGSSRLRFIEQFKVPLTKEIYQTWKKQKR